MNKKAVSIMIGYVLLISTAVIIGAMVYQWMKTYVPADSMECPEGTSLIIKEFDCYSDITSGNWGINLTVKNNGRFNLNGYFIKATNISDQEVATKDLSNYISIGQGRGMVLIAGELSPGKEKSQMIFDLTNSKLNKIYSIEIIPAKNIVIKNKKRIVGCTKSKIREKVNCSMP